MRFHIITLFPQMFDSYLNESILSRAQEKKLIKFKFYDPRSVIKPTKKQKLNKKPYLRVDDKPYGGGPGMVIQAEPIAKMVDKALSLINMKKSSNALIIHLSPGGKEFTNTEAKKISTNFTDIILICGRYEGIDARIKKIHKGAEYSVGNFVLTGGELPAMVLLDCISRQVKGVLGDFASLEESRISSHDVYTRPSVLVYKERKYKVPNILISGHHKKIDEWKIKK